MYHNTMCACHVQPAKKNDPVQTPISLDKGLYQHVHLFCLTFSANVGHCMALIEAYRGLDRVTELIQMATGGKVKVKEV